MPKENEKGKRQEREGLRLDERPSPVVVGGKRSSRFKPVVRGITVKLSEDLTGWVFGSCS